MLFKNIFRLNYIPFQGLSLSEGLSYIILSIFLVNIHLVFVFSSFPFAYLMLLICLV